MKQGNIIIPLGSNLEKHEIETVSLFASLGKDIEVLVPQRTKNSKTPDIKMDALLWEIKSPKGDGKYNLQHSFKSALRQSANLIFDLHRIKIPELKAVEKLKKEFVLSKKARDMLIVTKDKQVLDFKK
jgi:hypothetical protein